VLSDLQSRAAYDKDSNGFMKANGEYSDDAALALFERFFSTVSGPSHPLPPTQSPSPYPPRFSTRTYFSLHLYVCFVRATRLLR
jgi:hypothetical protein